MKPLLSALSSRSAAPWLLSAGLGFLTACSVLPQPQTDTVRHFTLSNPVGTAPAANGTLVRPVQLAGHLRNRSMAVRVAENEVIYLEDVRWAESLDEAITQLLRARLGPLESGASVTVQVQRWELVRSEGNRVELAATYLIAPTEGDPASVRRGTFTTTTRMWDGKDYGFLVGQLREAVDELGDAIATRIAPKAAPAPAVETK